MSYRNIETCGIYHIFNRGCDKRKTFLCEQDYFRFMNYLIRFNTNKRVNIRNKFKVQLVSDNLVLIDCFTLMPNHFHNSVRLFSVYKYKKISIITGEMNIAVIFVAIIMIYATFFLTWTGFSGMKTIFNTRMEIDDVPGINRWVFAYPVTFFILSLFLAKESDSMAVSLPMVIHSVSS
jgi:hypothetical protein